MACPTCDHTMALVATPIPNEEEVFHCPRCGTVKVQRSSLPHEIVHTPRLVERCRDLQQRLPGMSQTTTCRLMWRVLGIAESINLPENRGLFA